MMKICGRNEDCQKSKSYNKLTEAVQVAYINFACDIATCALYCKKTESSSKKERKKNKDFLVR